MKIKEYAKYNIPSTVDDKPIPGHLNNLHAQPFTEAIVRRKVAKCYAIKPNLVTEIRIRKV